MFFLVTGASGVGKSTVRHLIEDDLAPEVIPAELVEIAGPPQWTLAWRHQAIEAVVQRALEEQGAGRHFLLCGDPVPPGELYAAPSAPQLDDIRICLLDASEDAQRRRLTERGDDPSLVPHHVAFAQWMREHVADPRSRPNVVISGGWEQMRWERWLEDPDLRWEAEVIDTSELSPEEVAALVLSWIGGQLA
jgi:hypothetical protein